MATDIALGGRRDGHRGCPRADGSQGLVPWPCDRGRHPSARDHRRVLRSRIAILPVVRGLLPLARIAALRASEPSASLLTSSGAAVLATPSRHTRRQWFLDPDLEDHSRPSRSRSGRYSLLRAFDTVGTSPSVRWVISEPYRPSSDGEGRDADRMRSRLRSCYRGKPDIPAGFPLTDRRIVARVGSPQLRRRESVRFAGEAVPRVSIRHSGRRGVSVRAAGITPARSSFRPAPRRASERANEPMR